MIGWRVGWIAGPGLGRQRRRLGAHVQHDRRRVRRAARRRGRAARAAGARGGGVGGAGAPARRDLRRAARVAAGAAGGRLVAAGRRGGAWARAREASAAMLAAGVAATGMDGLGRATSPRATCASCSAPSRSRGSRRWASGSAHRVGDPRADRRASVAATAAHGSESAPTQPGSSAVPPSIARCASCTPRRASSRATGRKLARRLGDDLSSTEGATRRGELLAELELADRRRRTTCTASRPRRPSARAWPARAALSDLLLERNQAFRTALLDLQHVTTLLGYLAGARAHARRRDARGLARAAGRRALRVARGARAGRRGGDGGRSGARDRARRREPRWAVPGRASVSHSGPSARRSTIRRSVVWLDAAQPERVAVDERRCGRGGSRLHGHDLRRSGGPAALGEERFAGDLVRTPGGGAITAIGTARLGLSTALAAPLGEDAAGDLIGPMLESRGRPARRPAQRAHAGHGRDADRPRARDGHLRPGRPRPRGRRRRARPRAP